MPSLRQHSVFVPMNSGPQPEPDARVGISVRRSCRRAAARSSTCSRQRWSRICSPAATGRPRSDAGAKPPRAATRPVTTTSHRDHPDQRRQSAQRPVTPRCAGHASWRHDSRTRSWRHDTFSAWTACRRRSRAGPDLVARSCCAGEGTGDDAVEELIVNGAFAMDSAETGSEQALAALAWPGARVLVGGLGLGFTVDGPARRPGRVGRRGGDRGRAGQLGVRGCDAATGSGGPRSARPALGRPTSVRC